MDTFPVNYHPVPSGLNPVGWAATGSRVICNPPVLDTDEDFLVLVFSLKGAIQFLTEDGWEVNVDDPEYQRGLWQEIEFVTARKGPVNLILYDNDEGFSAFRMATDVARKLNLLNKEDRVALFTAVMAGRGRH